MKGVSDLGSFSASAIQDILQNAMNREHSTTWGRLHFAFLLSMFYHWCWLASVNRLQVAIKSYRSISCYFDYILFNDLNGCGLVSAFLLQKWLAILAVLSTSSVFFRAVFCVGLSAVAFQGYMIDYILCCIAFVFCTFSNIVSIDNSTSVFWSGG